MHRTSRGSVPMLLLALPLMLATLVPAAADGAGPHEVQIRNSAFDPTPLAVDAGDVVRWTNHDGFPHTVTCRAGSCDFDSGSLFQGDTFETTVEGAGTQEYFCAFHPGMVGHLHVGSGDAADPDLAPDADTLRAERPLLADAGVITLADPNRATLAIDVTNEGGTTSAPVTVRFAVAADAGDDPDVVGHATLPALAPGERATAQVDWTNAPLQGEATVTVTVDVDNAAIEGSEVDNRATGTVHLDYP